MLTILRLVFLTILGVWFSVSAALAANVALLVGNSTYRDSGTVKNGVAVLNATGPFRDAGYSIISGRNLDDRQTQRAVDGFLARVDAADGVAVVLSGRFVHSDNDTWFLPVDARADSLADVYGRGVSINVLLDIVSAKPGRAAIFLATMPDSLKTGTGLNPGIGKFQIPQGVLLVKGAPADVDRALRQGFLLPGMGFKAALDAVPGIEGAGFISNLGSLRPARTSAGRDTGGQDNGYWQAVSDLGGTGDGLRAYLRAFPNGRHAADARDRLNPKPSKTPGEITRNTEAALGLSRTDRRDIQRNLTALGYKTYGIDGVFGRASRAAIAAWQGDQGMPVTEYMTEDQITSLNRQAARAANARARAAEQQRRVREAADRNYWITSGAVNGTEKGLRRYLSRYPGGIYAVQANRELRAIIAARKNAAAARERNAWDNTALLNSIIGYQTFLSQFPNGYYAGIAANRLNDLSQARQTQKARKKDKEYWVATGAKSGDEQGLRAYLQRFPNGIFADKARKRLNAIKAAKNNTAGPKEQIAWNIARLTNSIGGYKVFLLAFPNAQFSGEARARLAALQDAQQLSPKAKAKQAE